MSLRGRHGLARVGATTFAIAAVVATTGGAVRKAAAISGARESGGAVVHRAINPTGLGRFFRTPGKVSHHSATRSASSLSSCASSQLTTAYWTSVPAMAVVLSGFDVTNSSQTACELPLSPTSVELVAADGSVVPFVPMPGPGGINSASDFVDYSMLAPSLTSSLPAVPPLSSPVELLPGTEAVVVVDTITDLDPAEQSCLVGQPTDHLAVSLGRGGAFDVAIPHSPLLQAGADVSGSAFLTCQQAIVYPFLTWSEAVSVVGPPVPERADGQMLALRGYNLLYSNAP